jgi:uroporphyrinogen III methyltransferase/synthase
VHLVTGDPFGRESVVKEVQAVARTAVSFEVVPGIDHAAGVASYAGVPLTGVRTTADIDEISTVDFSALAAAVSRGSLALTVDAGELAEVRDGLLAAGVDGATPVAVTGDGTGETQYTTISTVDSFVAAALGFTGRVVLTVGADVAQREKLSWWESRPLYGWKVLVPRTKEQAGAMSERLRQYGAIPTEVPTIAVEPPRTPAQMERAIKGLVDGRYAWIIFTSANAVKAVWEKFNEHGLDARHFGGVKIGCIGPVTADAVRAFGIQPELMPEGVQTSEGLLADFPPYDDLLDPVGRVLLPRADIATETLAAGLVERGWEVDDVTAYRTVRASPPPAEIRDAIKSGGFDAVLFTSSSTVRNLVGIAGKPHARTVVAAIGPKTAETAVEFGLRVDVQPPHATVADQVEALAEYAVELREKLATMPAKQRRGSKVQGPTALRFR